MADDLDLGQTITGLRAGQKVFDRYILREVLGRGGMGVVWLARDETLETEVALKFLPEAVAHDPAAVNDLKRETRRSLQLTHPNIVRIFDFVQNGSAAAIAMEHVDGQTLTQLRLDRPNQVFEVAELTGWLVQLCAALDYAHQKAKVVHRDLKPSNLMVDAQGDLKITDFGISATLADSTTRVSKVAGTSGTPVYMSPQQMMGGKPAVSDDIYAVGATLYELLTGKPPFYTGNIVMQVQGRTAPSLREKREELGITGGSISAAWEEAIAACLAKDDTQRPQTAGEIAAWINGQPPLPAARRPANETPKASTPPKSVPTARVQGQPTVARSRSKLVWLGPFVAGLALAGGGWFFLVHQPAERARQEEAARAQLEEQNRARLKAESEKKAAEEARLAAEARRLEAEQQARLKEQLFELEQTVAATGRKLEGLANAKHPKLSDLIAQFQSLVKIGYGNKSANDLAGAVKAFQRAEDLARQTVAADEVATKAKALTEELAAVLKSWNWLEAPPYAVGREALQTSLRQAVELDRAGDFAQALERATSGTSAARRLNDAHEADLRNAAAARAKAARLRQSIEAAYSARLSDINQRYSQIPQETKIEETDWKMHRDIEGQKWSHTVTYDDYSFFPAVTRRTITIYIDGSRDPAFSRDQPVRTTSKLKQMNMFNPNSYASKYEFYNRSGSIARERLSEQSRALDREKGALLARLDRMSLSELDEQERVLLRGQSR